MAAGHPVEKAESVLEDLIHRYGLEGKLQETRLGQVWPQVVGPAIAAATRPVRVKNGVLLVQVKSSTWVQELSFRRRYILDKLAGYLPGVRIRHIDFRTSWQDKAVVPEEDVIPPGPPLPTLEELQGIALSSQEQQEIEEVVAHLSDREMQETLRRTMTHEVQSRKWRIQHGWKPCPRCRTLFYGEEGYCPICRMETGQIGTS